MKKKILSLVLVVCMLASMSTSVFATGSSVEDTTTSFVTTSKTQEIDSRKIDYYGEYDIYKGDSNLSKSFDVAAGWFGSDHNAFSTVVDNNPDNLNDCNKVYVTIKGSDGYSYKSSSYSGKFTLTTTNADPDVSYTVTVHPLQQWENYTHATGNISITSYSV